MRERGLAVDGSSGLAVPSRPTARSWISAAAIILSRPRRVTGSMKLASGSEASLATSSGQWRGKVRRLTSCSPPGVTPMPPSASSARPSVVLGIRTCASSRSTGIWTYPAAVKALKEEGTLRHDCRLRQCQYLNNVIEQDHRAVKKRVWLAKSYVSFRTAWRRLQGIESVSTIRKRRARWAAKGDAVAQARFISRLFGLAT